MHGGWKSNVVAEGYIEASEENEKKTAFKILGEGTSSRLQNGMDNEIQAKIFQLIKFLLLTKISRLFIVNGCIFQQLLK